MKIAVTSQNFRTVTNHAGKARRFLVYNIDDNGNIEEGERIDLPKDMSFHELDHDAVHPVDGVDVLISASFGGGFAGKMQKRGITASLTVQDDPLAAVKEYLEKGQVLPAPPEAKSNNGQGCSCSCHCHGE